MLDPARCFTIRSRREIERERERRSKGEREDIEGGGRHRFNIATCFSLWKKRRIYHANPS
jgi:hypothetical protein